MSKKTTSRTEKEFSILEAVLGDSSGHFKTTISDGDKKVEGRGSTPEESQKSASDKYHR